ncbi:hypothetical protein, partial [Escherichia coli]|uniref:hypothetical protein n=1 Tax=Escherichia coli TaxID=562 RepID=UPI0022F2B75A
GISVLQLEANTLLAVTCQVNAAIGRIQGISAVVQLETCTICAVTRQVDAAISRIQGISATLRIDAKRLCAVTRQVDIVCSEGVVTSYLDGIFCDRHPIQADAAIGRIQGVGAVPFTQIEPNALGYYPLG